MVEMTVETAEGATASFDYDMPESLDAAIEAYGKDVAESYALRGLTVAIQGHARGLLRGGKSVEEIQTAMKAWKPGLPRQTKTAEERFHAMWEKMTPEERKRIQADLKAAGKKEAA